MHTLRSPGRTLMEQTLPALHSPSLPSGPCSCSFRCSDSLADCVTSSHSLSIPASYTVKEGDRQASALHARHHLLLSAPRLSGHCIPGPGSAPNSLTSLPRASSTPTLTPCPQDPAGPSAPSHPLTSRSPESRSADWRRVLRTKSRGGQASGPPAPTHWVWPTHTHWGRGLLFRIISGREFHIELDVICHQMTEVPNNSKKMTESEFK